jgi:hypothetical protein
MVRTSSTETTEHHTTHAKRNWRGSAMPLSVPADGAGQSCANWR